MPPFDHPNPDWTPRLAWSDPIPLRWVRVASGLWFVWPPRQFETVDPDGVTVWRLDFFGYQPERPRLSTAKDAGAIDGDLSKPPLVPWGGPLPTDWKSYGDGRAIVSISGFEVSLSKARVLFRFASSFGQHKLDYYYPHFIWTPPVLPHSPWASSRCGDLSPPDATKRTWFYPTPDGRRWVANAWIEPTGVTIEPLSCLLPLDLPSDAEIAAEEDDIRTIFRLEENEPLHVRPHTLMLRDLATSAVLMERVGEDAFASNFQMFVSHNDFMHSPTGKLVNFNSDNNGAWMLSILRRYGEIWQDCELFREENSPEYREELERLFHEVGYTVYNPPFDEEARREQLKTIVTSMPRLIAEHILGNRDMSPMIQLAWAMGHFWSEEDGWKEPELPLSSEKYRSLIGGHLETAGEILKLIETEDVKELLQKS